MYEKSKLMWDDEIFINPPKEYRAMPFWAWNTKMTRERIDNMLSVLEKMGMGGAFIHSRTGMSLPYLGEEFMELVSYTHEAGKQRGMYTGLYDEDRWPSGYGGGLVTKEEKYRARFLVFSPKPLAPGEVDGQEHFDSSGEAVLSGNRTLLARYGVKLVQGRLQSYKRLDSSAALPTGYDEWFAYLEIAGDNPWFNNQAYVNTLDEEAIKAFIQVTYETYYQALGQDFGKQIPVIFTDEPQFSFKTLLKYGTERVMQILPFTDDFDTTFMAAYDASLIAHLPEVFWEMADGRPSVIRYQYHDHVCERFVKAYSDQIGAWCQAHGIILTGHMMREPFLGEQTYALSEAMRSYRSFGLPGIDMLCDRRELTTAKQASSAAHQYGCPGIASEMYGVTNWDFDFRGHKAAGDWQAALGVTLRVPHLTWTTMAGEAKRDFPAPIGYQSPWYEEYGRIENYFARLNTALTRGQPDVRIGVIHPIESYWLYWGPREHTEEIRAELEDNFQNLTRWLVYGLLDFDFISEALLADLPAAGEIAGDEGNAEFIVGQMAYDVILVPGCKALRSSTLNRLKAFKHQGGRVIFAGEPGQYVDALPSPAIAELAAGVTVPFSRTGILTALNGFRTVEISNQEGLRPANLLCQMRREDKEKWLFVCHGEKMVNPDIPTAETLNIEVQGLWQVMKYNPLDGSKERIKSCYKAGKTIFTELSYDYDSFLYRLLPMAGNDEQSCLTGSSLLSEEKMNIIKVINFSDVYPVRLAEPNVLPLDIGKYRFDDEPWQAAEEILRIDNLFRERLGLEKRTEAFPQPWVWPVEKAAAHVLALQFTIVAERELTGVELALEAVEEATVFLNNSKVDMAVTGWYADQDIKKIALPKIHQGKNILEIQMPFSRRSHIEASYLLGDFGVRLEGQQGILTASQKQLAFADLRFQGFPFYGGNLTYQIPFIQEQDNCLVLEISKFRCPFMKVELDKEDKGGIMISPYQLDLGWVERGRHELTITIFGNRVNTFGPIHNCNEKETWIGPDAWRTTGAAWAYEYQLKPSGILKSPVLKVVAAPAVKGRQEG